MPLIEKVRLEFSSFKDGEVILEPNSTADKIIIPIQGRVEMEYCPIDGVSMEWTAQENSPLDLLSIFSVSQSHLFGARARGSVSTVSVGKAQFRKLYQSQPIILQNILNIVGRAASLMPIAPMGNTISLWVQSCARIARTQYVKILTTTDRLTELLSMNSETLFNQLKELSTNKHIEYELSRDHLVFTCRFE